MKPHAPRRAHRALALIAVTLLTLTGCATSSGGSPMPHDDELLQEADASLAALNTKMAELFEVLDPAGDAPVDPAEAGDPQSVEIKTCNSDETAYHWASRSDLGNHDGWRFPKNETEWRIEIGEQLHELGWENIEGTSFGDDGPDTTMVYATYPDVIDEAMLQFHPGDVADGVTIRLTGTCQEGSYREVLDLFRERAGN